MTSGPGVAPATGTHVASLDLAVLLIADDEAAIRRWLCMALSPYVKAVHTADTVAEGQRLAYRLPHLDLLIANAGLPDRRLRLADLVRVWHPHVRVLTISRYPCDQTAEPCVSFLAKPFTLAQLLTRLREMLQIVDA